MPNHVGRPTKQETSLRQRDLNRNQLAYVVWAATPPDLREPKTKSELCEVLGITTVAMWKWEKDPRVLDAIRYVVLQNAGDPLRVSMILDMLHSKALADKDREAARVWLGAVGVTGQFGRANTVLDSLDSDPEVGFTDFSLEQLKAMRAAADAAALENEQVRLAKIALAKNPEAPAERA